MALLSTARGFQYGADVAISAALSRSVAQQLEDSCGSPFDVMSVGHDPSAGAARGRGPRRISHAEIG